MTEITVDRFQEAMDGDEGFCTYCKDFTRSETEPDAEKYDCPDCGNQTVCGAEQALLLGLVSFSEDE